MSSKIQSEQKWELGLCEIIAGVALLASIILLVCVTWGESYRNDYAPARKDTTHMTGPSWNVIKYKKDSEWSPIGVAAVIPLFGNVMDYDYILEKSVQNGQQLYRVKNMKNGIILPIADSGRLTNNAIITIGDPINPYADRMLIRIPQSKTVEKIPPFPEADVINFP